MSLTDHAAETTRVPATEMPATEVVTSWKVCCEGDESRGLGHPRVWLAISPETGRVSCGYCDKLFVIDAAAAADH